MTAALLTDRWALRCGEPTHLEHKTVFMTCAEQERLAVLLPSWSCFELVDLTPTAAISEVSDESR